MSILIQQPSLIPGTQPTGADVTQQALRIKVGSKDANVSVSNALIKLQEAIQSIEQVMRQTKNNELPNLFITAPGGEVIGWIGTYNGYQGAWFKRLYVGGTDPSTAPFFADVDGEVIIGKNGSVSVQMQDESEVGYIGVKTDAIKSITAATNATPVVITINAHGYSDGDTVYIYGATGNTAINGYRLVKNKTANTFEITNLAGANVVGNGAFAGPAKAQRYFAGGYFQALAAGGTGFDDARIRTWVNGDVTIDNALITLTSATGTIVLDPADPSIVITDTGTGRTTTLDIGGIYLLVPSTNDGTTINPGDLSLVNAQIDSTYGPFRISGYSTIGLGPSTDYYQGRGNALTPGQTKSGDALGGFYATGTASSGTNYRAASIHAYASQDWAVAAQGAELSFFTTPNGSSSNLTKQWKIANNGDLLAVSGKNIGASGGNQPSEIYASAFVDAVAYKVGGVAGVNLSSDLVSNVTFTTGTAVTSISGPSVVMGTTTVVTGITVTKAARVFSKGILTT